MGTVHLIHGYLGSGKTTFAESLAEKTGAILLSADDWYTRLYVGDEPTPHLDDDLWNRMMDVLQQLWVDLAGRGVDVVLDFGFWSRSTRDEARSLARGTGADVRLHKVICDEAIARRRCLVRNANPKGSFLIHDDAFDELQPRFEPLGPDEDAETVDTNP